MHHRAVRRLTSSLAADAARNRLLDELCAPMPVVRLDNLLSNSGYCPRKEVRRFCRDSVVESRPAGGPPVRHVLGSERVHPGVIHVNEEPIPFAGTQLHVALHKPAGVVCSHDEPGQRLVYSLLPPAFQARKAWLHSVGRLDKDTTGLLLFTQCGWLTARLTSPRRACEKAYVAQLDAPLRGDEADVFARGGLTLVDGTVCLPARLQPHPAHARVCRVTLQEGRYHQVKRMFAAVGHRVAALHREAFGGLTLQGMGLKEGQWRLLTRGELDTLLRHSEPGVAQMRVKPAQRVRIRSPAPVRRRGDEIEGDVSSDGEEEAVSDDGDELQQLQEGVLDTNDEPHGTAGRRPRHGARVLL